MFSPSVSTVEGARVIVVTPDDGKQLLSYYLGGRPSPPGGRGARVFEIAVVAGAVRALGSVTGASPPGRATPPAPAGFEFTSRLIERYYTVIAYRAAAKRRVTTQALLALALGEDPELLVEVG